MNNAMGRILIFLWLCALIVPAAASAWSVTKEIDFPDETHFVVKCDNGATVTVKQMRPANPRLAYMNGWWLVVGGSYFNFASQDAAVKAACNTAKETK